MVRAIAARFDFPRVDSTPKHPRSSVLLPESDSLASFNALRSSSEAIAPACAPSFTLLRLALFSKHANQLFEPSLSLLTYSTARAVSGVRWLRAVLSPRSSVSTGRRASNLSSTSAVQAGGLVQAIMGRGHQLRPACSSLFVTPRPASVAAQTLLTSFLFHRVSRSVRRVYYYITSTPSWTCV